MYKRIVLVLLLLIALIGCSDDGVDPVTDPTQDTGLINGEIGPQGQDFHITIPTAGDPNHPVHGPFMLSGSNLQYDDNAQALTVDLTVTNTGRVTHAEPISLTFVDLIPDGVEVINPDNDEHGPGAEIVFHFENDDALWTPGESSMPRHVEFSVDPGTSVGFVAQLNLGTQPTGGTIGGAVWEDLNENGERDDGEPGLAGVTILLERIDGPEPIWRTRTDADGGYQFENLRTGSYQVFKAFNDRYRSTTPANIYVLLTESNGEVSDFLDADFGCVKVDGGPPYPIHIGDRANAIGKFVPGDFAAPFIMAREVAVTHCDEDSVCVPEDCPCLDLTGRVRGEVTDKNIDGRILYVMGAPILFGISTITSAQQDLTFDDVKVGDRVEVVAQQFGNVQPPTALELRAWEGDSDEVRGRVDWVEYMHDRVYAFVILGVRVVVPDTTN